VSRSAFFGASFANSSMMSASVSSSGLEQGRGTKETRRGARCSFAPDDRAGVARARPARDHESQTFEDVAAGWSARTAEKPRSVRSPGARRIGASWIAAKRMLMLQTLARQSMHERIGRLACPVRETVNCSASVAKPTRATESRLRTRGASSMAGFGERRRPGPVPVRQGK